MLLRALWVALQLSVPPETLPLLLVAAGLGVSFLEALAPGAHFIVLGVSLLAAGLVGLVLGSIASPVILAGDEIGMGEDLSLDERDPVRTPMQWSDDRNAGFSTADADDLILPVIDDGEFSYREINVADQLGEPYSLYNRIAAIAHTRSVCSELWQGEFGQVPVDADDVWVFRAEYEDTVLITVHNLSGEYREVTIDPGLPWGATADLLGPGHYEFEEGGPMTFYLDGYDYIWVRGDSESERVPLGQP